MGVGENCLATGYILKVELKGFADVLEVWGCERKRRIMDVFKFYP